MITINKYIKINISIYIRPKKLEMGGQPHENRIRDDRILRKALEGKRMGKRPCIQWDEIVKRDIRLLLNVRLENDGETFCGWKTLIEKGMVRTTTKVPWEEDVPSIII